MKQDDRSGGRTGEYQSLSAHAARKPTVPDAQSQGESPSRPRTPPSLANVIGEIRNGDLDRPMDYSDFAMQLGLHFRLPERPELPPVSQQAPRVRGSRRWLIALATVMVVGAGSVSAMKQIKPVDATLPPHLYGEWKPASARYAGRSLTLSEGRVRIVFGDIAAPVEFPVTQVQKSVSADTARFDLIYLQERGETRLTIKYVDALVPEIVLANPPGVIWRRDRDLLPAAPPTARGRRAAESRAADSLVSRER